MALLGALWSFLPAVKIRWLVVLVVVALTALVAVLAINEPAQTPGFDRACGRGRGCVYGRAWSDDVGVEGGRNGCDTRNDLLRQTLRDVQLKPGTHGCVVVAGILTDPYTGAEVVFSKAHASEVQVDHV